MAEIPCRICGAPTKPLFHSPSETAIISSARPIPGATELDLCHECGHAQTRPIVDLHKYYSTEYKFQLSSPEEDDLYERIGTRSVFRSEHQGKVALSKLSLTPGMKILDYGCGKAVTLRAIVAQSSAVEPYVFDVTEAYQDLWDEFVPRDSQACFEIPQHWLGRMDVVLAFFALEHVEDPHGFLAEVESLLAPDGQLLLIVPNIRTNISDFLVVDHVNHFSISSLHGALSQHGLTDISIDDAIYRGAFVVTARKSATTAAAESTSAAVMEHVQAMKRDAGLLLDGLAAVRAAELAKSPGEKTVVYGSGIYGLFIASHLEDKASFLGFVDQNPFRQRFTFFDRPVLDPSALPDEATIVFVGLNPKIARNVIGGMEGIHRNGRKFVYLLP